MVHCVAFGCCNQSSNTPKGIGGIHYFSFPKDKQYFKVWVERLKHKDYVWKPTHKLCSAHFVCEDYERNPIELARLGYPNANAKLKATAVPTVFQYTKTSTATGNAASTTPRRGLLKRRRIEVLENAYEEYSGISEVDQVDTNINGVTLTDNENQTVPSDTHSTDHVDRNIQVKPDVRVKGITCKPKVLDKQTQSKKVTLVNVGIQHVSETKVTKDASTQCDIRFLRPNTGIKENIYEPCSYVDDDYEDDDDNYDDDDYEETHSNLYEDDTDADPDYIPHNDIEDFDEISINYELEHDLPPDKENKFIIFQTQLLQLFLFCECMCEIVCKNIRVVGTMVVVETICKDGHEKSWYSQPQHKKMPWGNLIAAGSVLYTGGGYRKTAALFNHMNIPFISQSTFTRMQRAYLIPVVIDHWINTRNQMLEEMHDTDVIVGGDARCDSPGYCSKYGTYTLMDLEKNKILDTQIVQAQTRN